MSGGAMMQTSSAAYDKVVASRARYEDAYLVVVCRAALEGTLAPESPWYGPTPEQIKDRWVRQP